MKLSRVNLHIAAMTLREPFITSFGCEQRREFLLVEAIDDQGVTGWGECVAMSQPLYNEETIGTALHMLKDFIIPCLMAADIARPQAVSARLSYIRGNNMAKAAIENAVWDIFARQARQPLRQLLGGTKPVIDVGVSIGIQPDIHTLLTKVEQYLAEGYRRIKIKIRPGHDFQPLSAVRQHFPDVPLMADANSAYSLADADRLRQLDGLGLLMIEQPLAHDDIIDHAVLQKQLVTPICLDESILSPEDCRRALDIGACRIINIKQGRVGGLEPSRQIAGYCQDRGVPVWCGGMLETGIGRAVNIALTTLPAFTIPGDTSGYDRYWHEDIVTPDIVHHNGQIAVPDGPGLGYELDWHRLRKHLLCSQTIGHD
ncbi:MAG: o-succinylbenzoate synthase [Negativicutes bacterium]|nr:o-succinylbenzoate synthase [Negativicutes bacterium]